MVGVEEVESVLRQSLDPSELEVLDISGGCGASFELRIKSPKFNGLKLLDRHRLINEALAPIMDQIHAVSIKQAAPTTTSS